MKTNRITDGLSNTYLLGEKAMDRMRDHSGDDFSDRSPIASDPNDEGSNHSYVRYAARPPNVDLPNVCLTCRDLGSAHSTGWNTTNADGSARIIPHSMT